MVPYNARNMTLYDQALQEIRSTGSVPNMRQLVNQAIVEGLKRIPDIVQFVRSNTKGATLQRGKPKPRKLPPQAQATAIKPQGPIVTRQPSNPPRPKQSGVAQGWWDIITDEVTDAVYASTTDTVVGRYINVGNTALGRQAAMRASWAEEYMVDSITISLETELPDGTTTAPGTWGVAMTRNPAHTAPTAIQNFDYMDGAKWDSMMNTVSWKYHKPGETTPVKFVRFTSSQAHDTTTDQGIAYIWVSKSALTAGTLIGYIRIRAKYKVRGRSAPTLLPGNFTYWGSSTTQVYCFGQTVVSQSGLGVLTNAYILNNIMYLNGLTTGDVFIVTIWWYNIAAANATVPTMTVTNCTGSLWNGVNSLGTNTAITNANANLYTMVATGPNPTITFTGAGAWMTANTCVVTVQLQSCNGYGLNNLLTPSTNANLQATAKLADIGPTPQPHPVEPVTPDAISEVKTFPVAQNGTFVAVEALDPEEVALIETMRRAKVATS